MKLYTITDMTPGDDWEACWWVLVWAESEQDALDWARANYGGDYPHDQLALLVQGDHPELVAKYKPAGSLPCEERRDLVKRDAGWLTEGDRQCDCCQRYSLGFPEWYVCDACWCCPECADGGCDFCRDALST